MAKKSIELLSADKKLEAAKNKPIKQILDSLSEDEYLLVEGARYTQADSDKFSYADDADDVTIDMTDDFKVTGFEKRSYGWDLHLKAESKDVKPKSFWATSRVAPLENIKLFESADRGDAKKLKISMTKNRDKIKEAYIIGVEN